jgi:hypothetical protein
VLARLRPRPADTVTLRGSGTVGRRPRGSCTAWSTGSSPPAATGPNRPGSRPTPQAAHTSAWKGPNSSPGTPGRIMVGRWLEHRTQRCAHGQTVRAAGPDARLPGAASGGVYPSAVAVGDHRTVAPHVPVTASGPEDAPTRRSRVWFHDHKWLAEPPLRHAQRQRSPNSRPTGQRPEPAVTQQLHAVQPTARSAPPLADTSADSLV